MATMKQLQKGRKDVYMVDPKEIEEVPGWNARFDTEELKAHIEELKLSIAEIGVKTPLVVYMKEGVPTVVDGHCRLTAVKELLAEGVNIPAVPVEMEGKYSNDADRALSLLTRSLFLPLSMAEKAGVVKRLLDLGMIKSEIAKKAGLSLSGLENLLVFCAAPAAVQKMVKSGEVSASMAVETVKTHGSKATEVLKGAVETATKKGKRRATKKHLKETKISKEVKYYTMGAVHMVAEFLGGKDWKAIIQDSGLNVELGEADEAEVVLNEFPELRKRRKADADDTE